tara:strand:+ start:18867 stop:19316 length:450 start_codon:yes stop_codon:yes gene_type:complete
MGIFSRKKANNEERLDEIANELKGIAKEDSGLSALFFYKSPKGGSSFLQGDAGDIHKMLSSTAKQHSAFASIIKLVSHEIGNENNDGLDPRMPQGLRDILTGKKKSGLVDLPGGHKGIALDPKNIDKMTDSDVDDIINGLLGPQKDIDE